MEDPCKKTLVPFKTSRTFLEIPIREALETPWALKAQASYWSPLQENQASPQKMAFVHWEKMEAYNVWHTTFCNLQKKESLAEEKRWQMESSFTK